MPAVRAKIASAYSAGVENAGIGALLTAPSGRPRGGMPEERRVYAVTWAQTRKS